MMLLITSLGAVTVAGIFFLSAETLLAAPMEGGLPRELVVPPAQPCSAGLGDVQDSGSGSH